VWQHYRAKTNASTLGARHYAQRRSWGSRFVITRRRSPISADNNADVRRSRGACIPEQG
jgi:hypothetical protein